MKLLLNYPLKAINIYRYLQIRRRRRRSKLISGCWEKRMGKKKDRGILETKDGKKEWLLTQEGKEGETSSKRGRGRFGQEGTSNWIFHAGWMEGAGTGVCTPIGPGFFVLRRAPLIYISRFPSWRWGRRVDFLTFNASRVTRIQQEFSE